MLTVIMHIIMIVFRYHGVFDGAIPLLFFFHGEIDAWSPQQSVSRFSRCSPGGLIHSGCRLSHAEAWWRVDFAGRFRGRAPLPRERC